MEEDAVHEAAAFLRVDGPVARAIEGIVELEESLMRMRHALFASSEG